LHRNLIILIALLLSALFLGACALGPTGGGVPGPYCGPTALVAPVLIEPNDGGNFVLFTSHLYWAYPDATCEPEGYRVEINTASDFSGTMLGASTTMPNSYGWPIPLASDTTYYWRVRATVGATEGPWSVTWSFNAKPTCELSTLATPTPLWPSEGYEFMLDAPTYQWTYPDASCAPAGYHLQVSSDLAFTTIGLDMRDENPEMLWNPPAGTSLGNCLAWYWRVAAINGGTDGPWSDPVSFRINVAGACPPLPCGTEDLVAPEPTAPISYSVLSTLIPSLQWENPGYCVPESYVIHLSDIFDMSDTSLFGATGTPGTSWSPGDPLEPATQYFWEVAPGVDFTVGPFSFPKSTFFTGPECTSSSVIAPPELVFPAIGAEIELEFTWLFFSPSATGCIPDSYYIDLQTDSSFGGTSLYGTSHSPVTNLLKDLNGDCTRYYWRVAAIQDGIQGPFSETRWFYTNFAGSCMVSMIPDLFGEALVDLACRYGPGLQYEILVYFLNGEESPIHAQDLQHEWWVVENPDNPGELCWALQEGMLPHGDASSVPMWNASEEVKEEPTAPVCSSDLKTSEQCAAAGGIWTSSLTHVGGSYCKCE